MRLLMKLLMHPGTIRVVGSTLAIELFSSRFTMARIIHERYTHSESVLLSTPGGAEPAPNEALRPGCPRDSSAARTCILNL